MNEVCLKLGPGVNRIVMAPQMGLVEMEAPRSFAKFGHDCWMTSAWRPGDLKLHGFGFAEDFDSSTDVSRETGKAIEADMKMKLGTQYNVMWHREKKADGTYGAWHLHVEFDPHNEGVQAFHQRWLENQVVEA